VAGPAERPFTVVEIVGVAGAGKSTVTRALAETTGLHTVSRFRSLRHVPSYLASAARLALTLTRVRATDLRSWRGCNKMVRLRASLAAVRGHERHGCAGVVFDQGPLFLLTAIDGDRRGEPASASFSRWRSGELRRSRRTLDVVVMLEAPDEVLLERIRSRGKHHALKHLRDRPARSGLATMRSGLERVVDELASSGTVRVEWIDTSERSVEQTVRQIVRATSTLPGAFPAPSPEPS